MAFIIAIRSYHYIRLTLDGVPVLLHDENLKRTTGVHQLVSELTLALDVPDEDYMTAAHHAGLQVLFWTADNPYDRVEVDKFTADGVITNKPLMWKDWAARIQAKN